MNLDALELYKKEIHVKFPSATKVAFMVAYDSTKPVWEEIGAYTNPDKKNEIFIHNWTLGNYKVQVTQKGVTSCIASWKLYQLPHCCAICVSCSALVEVSYRVMGLGTIFNRVRQTIARELGYSLLMCTDVKSNEGQRKILKTNGWSDIYHVINKRTKNHVIISVINV